MKTKYPTFRIIKEQDQYKVQSKRFKWIPLWITLSNCSSYETARDHVECYQALRDQNECKVVWKEGVK